MLSMRKLYFLKLLFWRNENMTLMPSKLFNNQFETYTELNYNICDTINRTGFNIYVVKVDLY